MPRSTSSLSTVHSTRWQTTRSKGGRCQGFCSVMGEPEFRRAKCPPARRSRRIRIVADDLGAPFGQGLRQFAVAAPVVQHALGGAAHAQDEVPRLLHALALPGNPENCFVEPLESIEFRDVRIGQRLAHHLVEAGIRRPSEGHPRALAHDPEFAFVVPGMPADVGAVVNQAHPPVDDAQVVWIDVATDDAVPPALLHQSDQARSATAGIGFGMLERIDQNRAMPEAAEIENRIQVASTAPGIDQRAQQLRRFQLIRRLPPVVEDLEDMTSVAERHAFLAAAQHRQRPGRIDQPPGCRFGVGDSLVLQARRQRQPVAIRQPGLVAFDLRWQAVQEFRDARVVKRSGFVLDAFERLRPVACREAVREPTEPIDRGPVIRLSPPEVAVDEIGDDPCQASNPVKRQRKGRQSLGEVLCRARREEPDRVLRDADVRTVGRENLAGVVERRIHGVATNVVDDAFEVQRPWLGHGNDPDTPRSAASEHGARSIVSEAAPTTCPSVCSADRRPPARGSGPASALRHRE